MYVQSFIDVVEPDGNFSTGETIDIYNEEDLHSGYCVELQRSSQPSGYAVIRFDEHGPIISEFVTESNVENIYDEIAKKGNNSSQNPNQKIIYSYGINEYIIKQERNGEEIFLDLSGQELSAEEASEKKEDAKHLKAQMKKKQATEISTTRISAMNNERSGIYSSTPIDSAGDCIFDEYYNKDEEDDPLIDVVVIPDFAAYDIYTQKESEQNVGRFACSVMAILNLISYVHSHHLTNAFYGGSPWSTFNLVWDLTGTTVSYESNGYEYGFTPYINQKGAIQNYFNNYTSYECTVDEFWLIRSFDVFVQNIDDEHPCILDYYYTKADGTDGGHSVFVKGYLLTSNDNFLVVDDGWRSYPRFLNFSGYTFNDITGRAISIN